MIQISTPQMPTLIRAIYYMAFQKVPDNDMVAAVEMFGAVIEISNTQMKEVTKVTKREALSNLVDKICITKSQ